MDLIIPRKGHLLTDHPPALRLVRDGEAYAIPVKNKAYVMGSRLVSDYLRCANQSQVQAIELEAYEISSLQVMQGVGVEEAEYVGDALCDVLQLATLGEGQREGSTPAPRGRRSAWAHRQVSEN